MKNFDTWNKQKKIIDEFKSYSIYFHEQEIWWCSLGVNVGTEEDGKGINHERPVVILKKYNNNSCLIVPLTTSNKSGKYYFKINLSNTKRQSKAILSQIRFIDSKRLINRMGYIMKNEFVELKKATLEITLQ